MVRHNPRSFRVAVSSGAPVPGAGARQHYTHKDIFEALAARFSETPPDVVMTLQNRVTKETDLIVYPDDPAVKQPSKTALAKASPGVECQRLSAVLARFRMRPLGECESAFLRARLGTIGDPCVCDKGCYSKRCDPDARRCTKKPRKAATKQQTTTHTPKGRRKKA